jgi:hypothetical protein
MFIFDMECSYHPPEGHPGQLQTVVWFVSSRRLAPTVTSTFSVCCYSRYLSLWHCPTIWTGAWNTCTVGHNFQRDIITEDQNTVVTFTGQKWQSEFSKTVRIDFTESYRLCIRTVWYEAICATHNDFKIFVLMLFTPTKPVWVSELGVGGRGEFFLLYMGLTDIILHFMQMLSIRLFFRALDQHTHAPNLLE